MMITPMFDLYQMSVGSMLYCLKDIQAQLAELPDPNETLDERIAKAIGSMESARGVRFRWNVQNRTTTQGRGRAMETDNAIDKTLSAMNDHLVALGRNGKRPTRQQKARELKRAFFLNGVRPLSGLSYEDQLAAIQEMVERLESDFPDHVAACGLQVILEQLNDLIVQFADDLDVRQTDEVTFDQVKAAEATSREDFNHVLVTAMADYRDAPETLSSLMEQVIDQQDRIAAHLKRNSSIPEVDPNTGEVIEPGSDEPAEPAADDIDEPAEPVEPADPIEPAEPVDPAEPATDDPVDG